MALTRRRRLAPTAPASGYSREGEDGPVSPSLADRSLLVLRLAVIVLLALLSFAIFWVIGIMLNLF